MQNGLVGLDSNTYILHAKPFLVLLPFQFTLRICVTRFWWVVHSIKNSSGSSVIHLNHPTHSTFTTRQSPSYSNQNEFHDDHHLCGSTCHSLLRCCAPR